MIVVVEPDTVSRAALCDVAGTASEGVADLPAARRLIEDTPDADVVVIGPNVDVDASLELADAMRLARPMLGVVLIRPRIDTATLTNALRAGVREVVKDRDFEGLSGAVRRALDLAKAVRQQSGLDTADDKPSGRLVTVFSAKGGAGKTTLSTNLAAALADNGRRNVCLVDLDLAFGDVAIALQLFPAHTLSDAVPMADSLDEQAVAALLTPHSPGLTTLVAPVEPGAAESIPSSLIGRLLRVLKSQFDFVVVDTPPAFTDHVLAAFDESDYVALLATLDIPALKNLKLTLETLDILNYPRDRWRIVLNRADSKVGLQVQEVEKTLKVPITAQIPSSRDVPASINRGVPIMLDAPTHPVSLAIKEFAEREIAAGHTPLPQVARVLRNDNRRFTLRRRTEKS